MPRTDAARAWARVAYSVCLLLAFLGLANYWARGVTTNLMTVAQNERVMFVEPKSASDPLYAPLPVSRPDRLSILFVGNSQSYAIMDFQSGDRPLIAWLSHFLNGGEESGLSKYPVRFGAEANLRISEFLVKAVSMGVDSTRRPDVVIGAIVLDGLRWIDARTVMAEHVQTPPTRGELEALLRQEKELGRAVRAVEAMLTPARAVEPRADKNDSYLERSAVPAQLESWMQARLEDHLSLFSKRKTIYGWTVAKYQGLRDRVFGIGTASRRPIAPAMYATNLELIELSAAYLRQRGIEPVFYFAPVRPIEPNPYDPADVARFRQDLQALCSRRRLVCFDYSTLIPDAMWTNYPDAYYVPGQGGQRDYAHFTGRAHRTLANQLASDLRPHLDAWLAEKRSTHPAGEDNGSSPADPRPR